MLIAPVEGARGRPEEAAVGSHAAFSAPIFSRPGVASLSVQKLPDRIWTPVGAVQTQQDLPWWEMDDKQSDEKAHVQLLIPEGPVCSSFLRLRRADPGHVGTQVVMIDARSVNHRQEDVNQALERVDAEVTGVRFEVPGECGSLLDSGFC